MKICRYDDDRMGVVRGDLVHDVTEAQTEIRKSMPYAMKGDAVVAALPQWRERIERMADKAPGKPIAQVKLLAAGGAADQAHLRADQLPGAYRRDGKGAAAAGLADRALAVVEDPRSGHVPESQFRAGRPFGRHPDPLPRPAQRPRGRAGHGDRQDRQRHSAGEGARLCRLLRARSRHDRARPRGRSFRKSVDGYAVLGPWMVTADELPDPDNVPLSLTVNGETRQSSNTSQLIYNCRRLIEFASEFYTLYPGDLVYTGTPDGVGPVKPGDVIVCRSAPVLGELKIAVRAHEAGRVPSEQRVPA